MRGYRELGITLEEAMIILHLMDYAFNGSTPFPKVSTLATITGKHSNTVRSYIRSLRAKGYLETRARYGRSNAYDFSGLMQALEDPIQNLGKQPIQNPYRQPIQNLGRQTIQDLGRQPIQNLGRRKKKKKEETPENNIKTSKRNSPQIVRHDFMKLLELVSANLAKHGIRWKASLNRSKQLQAFMKSKKASFEELSAVLIWFSSSSHNNAEWLRKGGERNGRPYKLETLLRPSKFPGYLEMAEDEADTLVATPDRRTISPELEAERRREIAELEALEALDEHRIR